jgi:hypothetical protein
LVGAEEQAGSSPESQKAHILVAGQQRRRRRGSLGRVRGHLSCASIAVRHLGFSPRPSWAVTIEWPERQRSRSRVAKILNQFERMELDVIDSARASVPRHPRAAYPRNGNSRLLESMRSGTGSCLVPCGVAACRDCGRVGTSGDRRGRWLRKMPHSSLIARRNG